MKRLRFVVASGLLVSLIAGCGGGGIEVGAPSGEVKSVQTDEFKAAMEKAGNKMQMKGRPRAAKPSGQ
jgi:hypothetical protein